MSGRKSQNLKADQVMTDWEAFDALTDEDITKAMSEDPDWQYDMDIDWSKATLVIPQPKKAISIRLDADILEHLRGEGPGYQRRINAILRTYVEAQKARPKKKRA